MRCENCSHWITLRKTEYGDGSTIENWKSKEGGHCESLDMETAADFGCNRFYHGDSHIIVANKEGAPWTNFVMGKCPECNGRGSHQVELRPACRRCAGLGKVRHYDDGYIADASWDHPKEKELKRTGEVVLPGTTLTQLERKNAGLL